MLLLRKRPWMPTSVVRHRSWRRRVLPDPTVSLIAKDAILPEFLEIYLRVCQVPEFLEHTGTPLECVKTLYFPSSDEQYAILDSLKQISQETDIQAIQPYLMYYMVHDDPESVQALIQAYQQYQLSYQALLLGIRAMGS